MWSRDFQRSKSPTLVLSGDADVIVPYQNSAILQQKSPVHSFQIIEGGSHTFFIEQDQDLPSAFIRVSKMTFANIIGTNTFLRRSSRMTISAGFSARTSTSLSRSCPGIEERHYAAENESTADLATTQAAQRSHPSSVD